MKTILGRTSFVTPHLKRTTVTKASGQAPASVMSNALAHETVEVEGKTFTPVREGQAYILIPPEAPLLTNPLINAKEGPQRASVFYNPIQQYNRDLTILVIKAFGEDFIEKARAVVVRRNGRNAAKQQKSQKSARQKKSDGQPAVQPTMVSSTTPVESEEAQPNNAKRKREDNGHEVSDSSNSHIAGDKRPRLQSQNPQSVAGTQGPPLFSSMVKDRMASQEEVDDSFGDGGIGEDDFLLAEQNAQQTGQLMLEQNGHKDDTDRNANGLEDTERKPNFKILDALSASGLRALRYARELPFVTAITANDLSADAVKSIKRNVQYNGLHDSGIIRVVNNNAIAHMANAMVNNGQRYTVIDLDPYGTAVPFLDTAIQAVADGGLLCVTCTDTAIFNSMGYLEKCFSQYGGLPVKGDFCHEAGVRLILHAIATTAAKYGIAIEPLLSLSIDYYARVFVQIRKSSAEVKLLGAKTMLVYNCDSGCGSWTAQPLVRVQEKPTKKGETFFKFSAAQGPTTDPKCEHCGFKRHLAGPMWGGPLHNPAFLQRLLEMLETADPAIYQTLERARGMVSTALEETSLYIVPESVTSKAIKSSEDATEQEKSKEFARVPAQIVDKHPFYFDASSLSRVLHCVAPSKAQVQGALRHQGYRCVRSHAKPGSIKTDAPFSALWRIMKVWYARQGEKAGWKEGTAGYGILNNPALMQVDKAADEEPFEVCFDEVLGKQDASVRGLVRYQQNPRENWGPMSRAKVTSKQKKQTAEQA